MANVTKSSKKAVIATGGKQYLVAVGEQLNVELLKEEKKSVEFEPLLVIDNDQISVGTPVVSGTKVSADIIAADVQSEKVTSIRFKAKKRVHKVRGHRQRQSTIKITKIA
jgi:large subunit ribosomal protein L21